MAGGDDRAEFGRDEESALEQAPSASQQADLEELLVEQQTPGSANYHHWLTPEEYGQRFGVSDADIGKVIQWL